jgi:hypothetical protein
MVLYHANGRVVKAHEDYLEREAAKDATLEDNRYEEQIHVCKRHDPNADQRQPQVYIVVDCQKYYTLYASDKPGTLGEEFTDFRIGRSTRIPDEDGEGIDRATLMKCSSLADDFFRYNCAADDLHLPVKYPRMSALAEKGVDFVESYTRLKKPEIPPFPGLKYKERPEQHMAYIRPDEIRTYIVPWLRRMETYFAASPDERPDVTRVEIPGDLLGKIHLYNAMLQLGLPSSIQQPLIDALVAQMYKTNMGACHLDALEFTVCRFHSLGVPILDPVLSHFAGTYPFRTLRDRQNPAPRRPRGKDSTSKNTPAPEGAVSSLPTPPRTEIGTEMPLLEEIATTPFDFVTHSTRKLLDYAKHKNPERKNYPNDTFILPPRLAVLGHSLRHWSGVRRNGSTAAAYTGYPLNVGKVRKFYRRQAADAIRTATRNTDYLEYSTYRLEGDVHYGRSAPGQPAVESVVEEPAQDSPLSDPGEEPTALLEPASEPSS